IALDDNDQALMTCFFISPLNIPEKDLLSAYDAVITGLAARAPSEQDLERIRAKMRSDWYGQLEIPVERASILSHSTLFDGNPSRVNEIPDELNRVTTEQVREFAAKYLVPSNRTIIDRVPVKSAP